MRQEKGHRLNPKGFSQIPSFKGFKTELVSYAHSGCSIDKELEGQAWKQEDSEQATARIRDRDVVA